MGMTNETTSVGEVKLSFEQNNMMADQKKQHDRYKYHI